MKIDKDNFKTVNRDVLVDMLCSKETIRHNLYVAEEAVKADIALLKDVIIKKYGHSRL